MIDLIIATALLVQTPETGPACFISGEVYSAQNETKAELAPTNCPINIEQKGRLITFTSPKWVVQILIPEDIGKQQFLYEWGQSEAKIGNREVRVSYRPAAGA